MKRVARPRGSAPPARANDVVKMSVLARRSGVPAATIKHYLKEGLLPVAARTSRNMAYYDAALVPRIQRIKELQRTRFLPLKVIKTVLDEPQDASPEEAMAASVTGVLGQAAPADRRTARELFDSGLPRDQLDALVSLGVVAAASGKGDRRVFGGDDLEVLRVLGAARKAGLTAEMLPLGILGEYAEALTTLVRAELRMFREGVLPHAGERVSALSQAATVLSERFVVLMRRKLLVRLLKDPAPGTRRPGLRTRAPRSKRRDRGSRPNR